jgi:hypothetical protein
MSHWLYVAAAYAVAAGVLGGYWWRVERRVRAAERRQAGRRP